MTETAAPRSEPANHVQIWAQSVAEVLGQITGSPLPCVVLTEIPGEPPPEPGDLWITCASSGGLRGEMSLRIPAAAGLRLAQMFMSEPAAPEAEITSEHREAVIELWRQVAGVVATALKPNWGEVQLRLDPAAAAPSWPASSTTWLRAGEDPATAVLVEVQLSAALMAVLRAGTTENATAPTLASVPSSPEPGNAKLDLLMDVELALTLRFGSRRLLLREVLDLNPGAVVDLDRKVAEPIDVLLDGRLVARGEVVVMDGNYGVRITEVAPAAV